MISLQLRDLLVMLLKTILLLLFIDFISATILPNIASPYFNISINVLIVIFLCFHMPPTLLPYVIFLIHLMHSVFTIESWALGTIVGCLLSFILIKLRDVIQFSSYLSTVILVFTIQLAWNLLSGFILGLKVQSWHWVMVYLEHALIQGVILAILSPIFFAILKMIWVKKDQENFGSEGLI